MTDQPLREHRRFPAREWLEQVVAPRLEVQLPARYGCEAVRGAGVIQNISPYGALIDNVSHQIIPGSKLLLHTTFDTDVTELVLTAEVVRQTSLGFAVSFVNLDNYQLTLLVIGLLEVAKTRGAKREQGLLSPVLSVSG